MSPPPPLIAHTNPIKFKKKIKKKILKKNFKFANSILQK